MKHRGERSEREDGRGGQVGGEITGPLRVGVSIACHPQEAQETQAVAGQGGCGLREADGKTLTLFDPCPAWWYSLILSGLQGGD